MATNKISKMATKGNGPPPPLYLLFYSEKEEKDENLEAIIKVKDEGNALKTILETLNLKPNVVKWVLRGEDEKDILRKWHISEIMCLNQSISPN